MAKFSSQQRLHKEAEFLAAFSVKPQCSEHFFLYVKKNNQKQARLGLVTGKRFCKHAVRRNLIKRIAREIFRKNSVSLPAVDILVRLRKDFDKKNKILSYQELKANCFQELVYLIEQIRKKVCLEQ